MGEYALYYSAIAASWLFQTLIWIGEYVLYYSAVAASWLFQTVMWIAAMSVAIATTYAPIVAKTFRKGIRMGGAAAIGGVIGGGIMGSMIGVPGFVIGTFIGVIAEDVIVLLTGGSVQLGRLPGFVKGLIASIIAGAGAIIGWPFFIVGTFLGVILGDVINGNLPNSQRASI